jgi:hypothetical protein
VYPRFAPNACRNDICCNDIFRIRAAAALLLETSQGFVASGRARGQAALTNGYRNTVRRKE